MNLPVGKKRTGWGLTVAAYYWSIAVVGVLLLAAIEVLVRMFPISDPFFYSTAGRLIVFPWLLLMLVAVLSTVISPFVFAVASRWPPSTCRSVRKAILVFLASDILQVAVWRATGLSLYD